MNGHPDLPSGGTGLHPFVIRNDKGGDPAARSRTATLLRLHPNYRTQLGTGRPPGASVAADFHGVTGGVYKARERIHRGVLIRDY